jgi:hypothetical protein
MSIYIVLFHWEFAPTCFNCEGKRDKTGISQMKRRPFGEGTTAAREELLKVILVGLEHWDLEDRLVSSKSCMRLSTYQVKTRLSGVWNTSAVNIRFKVVQQRKPRSIRG